MNEGVVSKETVVMRRWGSSIQKFGFINGVDKTKILVFHLIPEKKTQVPKINRRDIEIELGVGENSSKTGGQVCPSPWLFQRRDSTQER